MKTLKVNNKEFKAEKIIRTNTDIIGYDNNGKEVFTFKGITDFSLFILDNGQQFDIDNPSVLDLQKTIFNLTSQLINGGIL